MNAVRRDLADIRLAEYVFAPHYAAPLAMAVVHATALRAGEDRGTQVLAELAPGDTFEALDFAAGSAWGIAPGRKLVGYVDRAALAVPGDSGAT